jgi:hypothetical protein
MQDENTEGMVALHREGSDLLRRTQTELGVYERG